MEKMVVDNNAFFTDVLSVLSEGRRATIPVKGYSMLPFIRGGKDLVVLEKAGGEIKADDIVLFHMGSAEGGRWIMHRVLSVRGDAVDIMGDGVIRNHEHVRRNQVYAKAVTILRGGTRPVDPYSPGQLRLVHFWQGIRPVRRYILFIYRHLPWNRSWIKQNVNR